MSEVQAEELHEIEEDQEVTEESSSEEVKEDSEENNDKDDDEVVVTIGDASPPSEEEEQAQAPAWVKELRKSHKEILRENKELKEKIKVQSQPKDEALVLGKEPDIADDDINFDPDLFKEKWKDWNTKKIKVEEKEAVARAKQEAESKAWQERLDSYAADKAKLKVPDFADAEDVLKEHFSQVQQGIILQGAENPVLLVYALGKNPAKAKELAAITDPVKYAFALAKLETQLKVSKRSAPAPEKMVSAKSASNLTNNAEAALERLRQKAEKTGDFSEVMAYRRQLREK